MSRPLLDALPRLLRIPICDGQGFAMVQELLRVGLRESGRVRAGREPLLAKLAELLFVEALRRYIETLPPDGKGWLAGVRDAQVGRALALIHNDPGRNWTVDELARLARWTAHPGDPKVGWLPDAFRPENRAAARALRSRRCRV